MRRTLRPAVFLLLLASPPAAAVAYGQAATRLETVVIVGGQEPASPIPTLFANSASNRAVSELLFLPLARLGPDNVTSGDKGFVPQLARSWTRRDSLTLVFEMDRRARWQDGTPVTARDAALAINLARDPAVDAQTALLMRLVAEATAPDESHLVVRFTEAYDEQLYDAVYHVYPLPAHLVDTIPRGALAKSAFATAPVGNGPYRWTRRVPKQQLELTAYDQFFLGKPGPRRVLYLTVGDAEARMNLLLSGDADVLAAPGTVSSVARVTADKRVRVYPMPTTIVGYLSFNQRDPADLNRPHPILSDPAVRAAIVKALDRRGMVQATFGSWASVPEGPVPQLFWIRDPGYKPAAADPAGARAQLVSRGWTDSDGDGVLDKAGKPLALTLNYPSQDAARGQLALQVQEQLRQVGIRIEINRLDGPVWVERRNRGEFDLDFAQGAMDPSPAGMVQSWSCAGRGGANKAYYCNPKVDSLLALALRAPKKEALSLYRQAVRTIAADAPAVFVYTLTTPMAVNARIRQVELIPVAPWSAVWRWAPGPSR
ncbi:MAG TPA: peptide ABC transporter substrate-binding protein [Gemmatimonadales bacterium]|nr:peptide ABC transporter substrate-binding protein [Gemmatimonadales bacterium]